MKLFFPLLLLSLPVLQFHAGPLSLSEAQATLFTNNLDIIAAQTDLQKAKDELAETRSAWYPSLDASANYSYISERSQLQLPIAIPGLPSPITIGYHDNVQIGADLTYPLFTGFSRYYAFSGRKKTIAEKEAALDETKNAVSFLLGLLYLQWDLAYRQAEVQRTLTSELDDYTRQTEERRKAGIVLQSTLLEARARLQLARADMVDANDRIDSLRREMQSLLLSPDSAMVPDTIAPLALDRLKPPKEIDTSRPELIALEQEGKQVDEARKALRFRHFPTIAGDVGVRYARPGLDIGIDKFMGWGLVGVSINWNLFDGLKTQAQDAELQRQLDYVDIARTRELETMQRTFEQAQRQVASAIKRLAACEESAVAAAALAEERKNQIASGTATSTDYLNALADLAQARLQAAEATMAKRAAMLRLRFAAGKEIRY